MHATNDHHLSSIAGTAFLPLSERVDGLAESRDVNAHRMTEWMELADHWAHACVRKRRVVDPTVRVGVKDVLDVRGWPTGLGIAVNRPGAATASVPALRGFSDAVIVAKTVTTELGIGLEHGCTNLAYPHLDPGGSSTGSAVSVANGICDISLGTDSVASVRLPAAACGVVGLRTSGSAGQLQPGFTLSEHLDAPGWLARTPDDLAWAWSHWIDRQSVIPESLAAVRVGIVSEAMDHVIDFPMASSVNVAAKALEQAGATVSTVKLGALFHDRRVAYDVCTLEAARAVETMPNIRDRLSRSTRLALQMSPKDPDLAIATMIGHRCEARQRLSKHSLWLLPTGSQLPLDLRYESRPETTIPTVEQTSATVNYAAMAALLGLPAISIPIAGETDEVPLSVQLIGSPGSEAMLIAAGREISRRVRLPPLKTLTLTNLVSMAAIR